MARRQTETLPPKSAKDKLARAGQELMDKTICRYTSYKEMKADEYRYWQSRPVHERMEAVSELTTVAYSLKGTALDVPGLQGRLVRLPRPKR